MQSIVLYNGVSLCITTPDPETQIPRNSNSRNPPHLVESYEAVQRSQVEGDKLARASGSRVFSIRLQGFECDVEGLGDLGFRVRVRV